MNLFQPSVKLIGKVRVGSRLRRCYDPPQTPLDRLWKHHHGNGHKVRALHQQREMFNPFELAQSVERQLEEVWRLAQPLRRPSAKAMAQRQKAKR